LGQNETKDQQAAPSTFLWNQQSTEEIIVSDFKNLAGLTQCGLRWFWSLEVQELICVTRFLTIHTY